MVPTHMFLTRGVGVHREKLASFEQALRSAGVAYCNLVSVSSILPPNCKIIPRKRGETLLNPGEITHCVMARSETNERNRLISASIGLAIPTDRRTYGYLSEHRLERTRASLQDGRQDRAHPEYHTIGDWKARTMDYRRCVGSVHSPGES